MSHDDQGQAGAKRAPGGRRVQVSSSVQGRQAIGAESQGISQRFPFWCNKTKTARMAGRRSSPSPPQSHDQRLFAGEDYFCQDRLYYLSPLKSLHCGIPSRSYLGIGPRPLYIGLSHHHGRGSDRFQPEHETSSRTPEETSRDCSSPVILSPP